MPCYDSRDDDYARETAKRNKFFKAALCGILRANPEVLSMVDWNRAGIARADVEEWFAEHKREDAENKKRQEAIWRTETIKQNAILKLSDIEKIALGIKVKK